MRLKPVVRSAHTLSDPCRVTSGRRFRLRDVDPADTGPFGANDEDRAKEIPAGRP